MNILVAHNFYQQPGGEDVVFRDESAALERRGHQVARYTVHNDVVEGESTISLALKTVWNRASYRAVRDLVERHAIEVAHFHNTLPLLSPAAYAGARAGGAAVVQSLHNYRMLCPSANLLREGRVCMDCVDRWFPLPSVRHACYRGSRSASLAVAGMLAAHRTRGTYLRQVDAYIAATPFAADLFGHHGLPADRIHVKGNFVPRPPEPGEHAGGFALFAGRLSEEKGVDTLLAAWQRGAAGVPLRIAGDGPLADRMRSLPEGVRWLGRISRTDVLSAMREAAFLVVPSTCFEAFPMSIVEAMAVGLPVIASDHGGIPGIVENGVSGVLVPPGDASALAHAAISLMRDEGRRRSLGANARRAFLERFTEEHNCEALMEVYRAALDHRHGGRANA